MIDQNEFLICNYYDELVKSLNNPSVVHVPTEEIADFFARTSDDEQLVVVSSFSDYSVRYQSLHHPNKDIIKHASAMNWARIGGLTDQYAAVQIGPTCNQEKCSVADKYAVKIDRHTIATFSRIPAGVRWFCTNLDIQHSQATWLPFGVNNDGHGKDILANYRGRPKKGLLYVNFQNNSYDRVHYKNFFRHQPWVTFRENANLPVEQYYEELSEHQFVLSPFGNGLDCYRNYEAMYLGTVPIMEESFMASFMQKCGMPILVSYDFTKLTSGELFDVFSPNDFNCEALTKSYWEGRIRG